MHPARLTLTASLTIEPNLPHRPLTVTVTVTDTPATGRHGAGRHGRQPVRHAHAVPPSDHRPAGARLRLQLRLHRCRRPHLGTAAAGVAT